MAALTRIIAVSILSVAVALPHLCRNAVADVIVSYPFSGGSAVSTDTELNSTADLFYKNPTTTDWGFSSSSSTAFARSNATTNSEASAITAGDYFSFMVTPSAGYAMDLTQLTFDTTHNSTYGTPPSPDTGATMSFFVRSSLDSFATNIGSTFTESWNSTTSRIVDLTSATFQGIADPTEFRFYIYDSGVDLLQNGGRLDNVSLEGTLGVADPTAVAKTRFQEGVSPYSTYVQDAVYIRSGETSASRADTNFNNDSDREMIVGFTADPDELRSLLEFDVSSIPATDQIDSVSLVLRTETSPTGQSDDITINLYEYGFDIDETTATWNDPGTGDTTPGGTLGDLLASATFDPTATGIDITFDDSEAFRSAVEDALAGDGYLRLLMARSDRSGSGHRFARFDDETVSTLGNRPELIINHSAPTVPEPTSIVLWALLGLGLTWFDRNRARK